MQGNAAGSTAELLDANVELISVIRARLAAGSGGDSRSLLGTLRENILTVMHRCALCGFALSASALTLVPVRRMETQQGIMAQMPQLPVLPNLELAERVLAPRLSAERHF